MGGQFLFILASSAKKMSLFFPFESYSQGEAAGMRSLGKKK